jgi:S1-C subfamily serine protease
VGDPGQPSPARSSRRTLATGAVLGAAAVGGGVLGAALFHEASTRTVTQTVLERPVARQPTPTAPDGPGTFSYDRAQAQRKSIHAIYEEDGPGVVAVVSTSRVSISPNFGIPGFSLPPQEQEQVSQGSGFVLDANGDILTNDHVVAGARKVRVSFSNQDNVPARVVGTDPSTDLALLRVQMPSSALHPLPLGDSTEAQVGDAVVAIGNPFGLDRTVTAGIVSALQRDITAPNGFTISNAIQTDAAINHGNSGGPLIDASGEVIGINAQIANSGVNGNVGIGFAIPIDTAKSVIAQLRRGGRVVHAWLGIDGSDIDSTLRQNARLPAQRGVLVRGVIPGSPAARAGIVGGRSSAVLNGTTYCLGGDVITTLDGRRLGSIDQLTAVLQRERPGQVVRLTVATPTGRTHRLVIRLGAQPKRSPARERTCTG